MSAEIQVQGHWPRAGITANSAFQKSSDLELTACTNMFFFYESVTNKEQGKCFLWSVQKDDEGSALHASYSLIWLGNLVKNYNLGVLQVNKNCIVDGTVNCPFKFQMKV